MTTRQKQLIENYIRLKVKKLMKEESAKDYPEVFSFIQKSRFSDRIMKLQKTLSEVSTINDMKNSGVHSDRLFSFFNSLNEKMKDIDFLVDNFSKELK